MKLAILFLGVLSLGQLALGEEIVATDGGPSGSLVVTKAPQSPAPAATPKPRKLTASLIIDTSTTLAPGADGSASAGEGYSQSGLYRLDVGVPLPGSLTASLRAGYSQEYTYVQNDGSSGGFTDSRLMLTKAAGEVLKNLSLSSVINLTLPTSKDSQRAGMKSALGAALPLTYTFKRWELSLSPAYTYFFDEYVVQNDGTPNIEQSVSLATSLGYNFSDQWSLALTFIPVHSWTYLHTTRDKYVDGAELGYKANDHLSLALGFITLASALKTNGLDYNYVFYDQTQSAGYLDLVISI